MRKVVQGQRRSLRQWESPRFPSCLSWKRGFMFWMQRVAEGAILAAICAFRWGNRFSLESHPLNVFAFIQIRLRNAPCYAFTWHNTLGCWLVCLIWDFRNVKLLHSTGWEWPAKILLAWLNLYLELRQFMISIHKWLCFRIQIIRAEWFIQRGEYFITHDDVLLLFMV